MSDNLLQEFIFDARDHLSTAGAQLLELENNPGDLDPLNALMGTLHTLKGNSGFLDLQNHYQLMHNAESLLQTIREKQSDCPRTVIDLLFQVMDTSEAIMVSLSTNGRDSVDWLGTLNQALSEAETQLESGAEQPGQAASPHDEDYSEVFEEAEPTEESSPEPELELEVIPGAPSLVTLADDYLERAGDRFPARVEAFFKAGGNSLMVDLKDLTSLTGHGVKLILAASRKKPDRMAFLVNPDEQPDLYRLFQVLDPDQKLNIFPDQAPALAHFGLAT